MSDKAAATTPVKIDTEPARAMTGAMAYAFPLEQTAYAASLEQHTKSHRQAREEQRNKAKAKAKRDADSASIFSTASFGSTVALLGKKLGRKSTEH